MEDEVRRLMRANNKRQLAESLLIAEGDAEIARRTAEAARADERQAMTYLSQCRQAIGHDGDFPSLVERLRQCAD